MYVILFILYLYYIIVYYVFYSHKYPDGDVVIIAINLDPRNNLLFNMEDPLSKLKADAFILQPVGDITSK